MRIYIPTYQRSHLLDGGTLRWTPPSLREHTVLVVREEEFDLYSKHLRGTGVKFLTLYDVTGIADTRQRIGHFALECGEDSFCMMDDDLIFSVRKEEYYLNLRPQSYEDFEQMISAMREYLAEYAQVGISLRQGNNSGGVGPSPLLQENGRAIRCVAFRTAEFNACEHGRVRVMEDMDVTLQLLTKGHKNAILYWWANDQQRTNAPGGCSVWRTHEVHAEAARRMADLWPGIVTLRQKENKTGGDFGTRTEVTCQWKKAARR